MNFRRFKSTVVEEKTFFNETNGKTIAVVGNSQALFKQSYGSIIDKHELVFRFNKPATLILDDVSKTHGTKLDFWAFWSIGAFQRDVMLNEDYSESIKDVFLNNNDIRKIQIRINGHRVLSKNYINYTLPGSMYAKLKNSLSSYSSQILTPSSGIGILEWLRQCNPRLVSVYGMDFKTSPTFSEPDRFDVDMVGMYDSRCKHDYGAEQQYANKYIFSDYRFKLYQ
jgi:hypothetical protein